MQCEDCGYEPRARYGQSAQDSKQQPYGETMQQNIDQMISKSGIAPKMIFKPKYAMNDWVILLRGSKVRPDTCQAIG